MTTPMQEMLEWVRTTLPMELDWPMMIEQKIKSLLEKEKEHIINAANFDSRSIAENGYRRGEQYYNETFNTNEQ
jgi:hypothetical protein